MYKRPVFQHSEDEIRQLWIELYEQFDGNRDDMLDAAIDELLTQREAADAKEGS